MARKKTAPTLRRLAMFDGAAWTEADERNAAAEFRALLTVAREAERFYAHAIQGDCSDACLEGRRIRSALVRLDRLSEPRKGR